MGECFKEIYTSITEEYGLTIYLFRNSYDKIYIAL